MKVKNVIEHASELYKAMEWKTFNEGEGNEEKRVVIVPRSGEVYDELLSITFKVSERFSLSTNSVYAFTMEALGLIADSMADTEDELRELDPEADVYTSELTGWLNESVYNVEYLTGAIADYDPDNGYDLLTQAQYMAKRDVLDEVLTYLLEK